MMRERPVGTVWLEETNNGVVLHMRVGTGADVMLTLPNASVAAQAEAQLCSVLAMATMQFQRVAKETTSGGTLWKGFMPEETNAHIAEQAEALVKPISDGRLDRPAPLGGRQLPALSGYGFALAAGLPAQCL